jgi:hypothetical protein
VDHQAVVSSLIRSVGYDPAASVLEVVLIEGGRAYAFYDVPWSVYEELLTAESKGLYFNEMIRDMYAFDEIEAGKGGAAMEGGRIDWGVVFSGASPYGAFLDRHATPAQRTRWDDLHARFAGAVDDGARAMLGGFVRRMPVLCLAGAWCGDCINQCPAFDHFARASAAIDLRFLDRDDLPEVRDALAINGGHRVPVVVFLSEDFQEVARYGERTLSTYRRLAAEQLGPACPTGIVPPSGDALARVASEWLAEFERAQLILRLSPRLRQKHGD